MNSKPKLFLTLLVVCAVGAGVGYGVNQAGKSHKSTKSLTTPTYTYTVPTSCHARDNGALPDPSCTPGLDNHVVVQSTINKTICVKGWTSTIRPPVSYTEPLKFKLMKAYGDGSNARDYELDHLIPLELGGSPTSPKNLWPEPHNIVFNGKQEGSYLKDGLENSLRSQVCNGTMKLSAARQEMRSGSWIGG